MGTVKFTEDGKQRVTVELPIKEITSETLNSYPRMSLAKMLEDKKELIVKMLQKREEAMTTQYAKACFSGKYIGSINNEHFYVRCNQVIGYSPDLIEFINGIILDFNDCNYETIADYHEALHQIKLALYWTNDEDRAATKEEKCRFADLLSALEANA